MQKADILLAIAFLLGITILIYPFVASTINARSQGKIVQTYEDSIAEELTEQKEKVRESAHEFNRLLYIDNNGHFGNINKSLDTRYWNELNINGDGVMGFLSIPSIDETLPIGHGTSDEVMINSVGHIESTSLPVGGENTQTVLSGHRGLPTSVLFSNLDKITVGDVMYLHILDETLAYQVDKIETVLPDETESLSVISGQDRITLITCTPYSINTHRLLVHGFRIPYSEEAEAATPVKFVVSSVNFITIGLLILAFIAGILLLKLIPRYYERKYEYESDDVEDIM